MGHEYVEMKNSHAAIEAYRRAVGKLRSWILPTTAADLVIRCESKGLSGMVWSWTSL
jgi:hypothetical protein